MTALFADTFYWIALADLTDSAHQRALYLTFFATVPEQMRAKRPAYADDAEGRTNTEVLTNDRHFEQEGFQALFRDS